LHSKSIGSTAVRANAAGVIVQLLLVFGLLFAGLGGRAAFAQVSVSVSPLTPSTTMGGTIQFSATVTGNSNTAVTWSVNTQIGGNPTFGMITTAGLYTAPLVVPSGTVTVTATSKADTTKSASTTVTLIAEAISLSPTAPSVTMGSTTQFTATVHNTTNTGITWSVNGQIGGNPTIGQVSTSGLYTAPLVVPSGTVAVKATGTGDTSKSASATITFLPETITIAPQSPTVQVGTTQQFTATVTNTTSTGVKWAVNGQFGGNATIGTISTSGLYTAPATIPSGSITVSATGVGDQSKIASTVVTLSTTPVTGTVTVSPTSATVITSHTQQFTATVKNSTAGVNWSVNGVAGGNNTVGTVSTSGLYTAPASVPSPANVTVTATNQTDSSKSGSAIVTVTVVGISVTPTSVTTQKGTTQQFTASVTGTTNTAVTWQVNGVTGGNSTVGTVSTSGLYTAPATVPSPATVTLTAISQADTSKSASASVTISATAPPVGISISPTSASVKASHLQQFTATVTNTTNTAVTWQVNGISGGNSTVGTINASGLYSAPSTVPSPATVTVKAISQADTSKSASASVTITVNTGGVLMIVPAYFDPAGDPSDWNRFATQAPAGSIAIVNPNNGPYIGNSASPINQTTDQTAINYQTKYKAQIATLHQHGLLAIGYVSTQGGCRPYVPYTSSNGIYHQGVNADIDEWFNLYGADGIFLDEGPGGGTWAGALPQFRDFTTGVMLNPYPSTGTTGQQYYTPVYNYIRNATGGPIVLNCGIPTDEGYMSACSILCNGEEPYGTYINNAWLDANFASTSWVYHYPSNRFLHLIYGTTSSVAGLNNAMSLAQTWNAGYVYSTDLGGWTGLASSTFWTNEVAYGSGNTPGAPGSLASSIVSAHVALTWSGVSGATSYNVYRATTTDGQLVGTPLASGLTGATYTDTTVTHGTTYYYRVTAVNSSGMSGASNEVTALP